MDTQTRINGRKPEIRDVHDLWTLMAAGLTPDSSWPGYSDLIDRIKTAQRHYLTAITKAE